MSENQDVGQTSHTQTIIIKQEEKKSNGIGTAGFILALIGIFIGWLPVIGWIVLFLGLLFSFIGIFKSPKGKAIAGLVISIVGLIIWAVVYAGIGGAFMF